MVKEHFTPSQKTLTDISRPVHNKEEDVKSPDDDLERSGGPTTASSSGGPLQTMPGSHQDLRSADKQAAAQLAAEEMIFREREHPVRRRGGCQGPLSKGGREAAAAVRDNGACLRCSIMKEQVSTFSVGWIIC